jgi:hypothetical protein
MRTLFGTGHGVPLTRVLREHRAALVPLAVVLLANLAVLGIVVAPLAGRVSANEARADAAERERSIASAEFKQAENLRDGKARASSDLQTFYGEILPADIAAARRLTHLRFQQKAREHGVQYQRGATSEERQRDATLDRLTVAMTLSGEYDDIRALLYELETSEDFFVIDNVALTESSEANAPLSVALQVSTYFRSAETATPAGSNGR